MAEDSCGNTATCTQSITINDTTAPVMTSPVTLTAYCSINEVPAYMTLQEFIIGGGSAMDNCELDTASFTLLSETSTPGNCPKIYTRTYQIADLCGNTATAGQMIWVNDSIAPQITCPAAVTVACIADVPAPDITLVVATDNCGIRVITWMSDVWAGNCPRIITRTYQAEDSCGNTTTCTQTITVNDSIAPTITCPAAVTVACITDVPAPDITLVVATDNCGTPVVTWISDVWAGNCPRIITRTYQAADSCGNTTTCTQTITVNDSIAPTITCPSNISVACVTDVPAPDITLVIASDNCGTPVVTWVSDVWAGNCPRIITRTYQAADSCGNTTTCTQTITVNDSIAPAITCPAAVTVACITDVPAPDITLVIASDNCGTPVVTWMSDVWAGNCPRIITRTYQAADSCGNTTTCTQTITVNDSIAPAITCPANVTVACITDVPAPDITLVIASDNCGTPVVTWISDVWAGNCPRIITRTYQAADSCGNTTTCTQTITVNDSIAPTITCPSNISVACVTDVPAPDITLVIASDNCGTPVVTWVSDVWAGNCPRIITRTYQAADSCGNTTTCTQTITVNDSIAPAITCPAAVTVACITDVPAPDITLVIASDNCGTPVVTWVSDVWAGNCPRIITRTYQAADSCGNTTTCTQTITVNDSIAPTITCPSNISVACVTDVPAPDITLVVATDNCGTPVVTWISDVWAGNCPRIITRTYQAADSCGNTTTCTQTITVNDSIAPAITCPANVTVACITDVPAPDITLVIASDNCGTPVVTWISDVWAGNCPRIITRTYQAADSCGNTTTCTQTITVNDSIAPAITCQTGGGRPDRNLLRPGCGARASTTGAVGGWSHAGASACGRHAPRPRCGGGGWQQARTTRSASRCQRTN